MTERDEASDRPRGDRPDKRDRLERAGHDAQQHAVWDAEQRETDRSDRGHEHDEDQLPSDVAAEHHVRVAKDMKDLHAMFAWNVALDGRKQTRCVAEHEERPDQKDQEAKEEVTRADDEWECVTRCHALQLSVEILKIRPDERVVEIAETDRIESVRNRLARVREEGWPGLLKVVRIVDDSGHEQSAATENDRKDAEEYDERRRGPREAEARLKCADDRQQDV